MCCSLFVVRCLLSVESRVMFAVWRLMFVVRCLLFVWCCCLLFVAWL